MKPLLLGIDSGSTATKAALFDLDGNVLAELSSPTPRSDGAPGHVERDPEAYWQSVALTIRNLVDSSGHDPGDIVGIGIAAQGDGVCLVDDDGLPVGPAILSSDTRAAAFVRRWKHDGTTQAVLSLTGQAPFPGSPAPLLAWLRENEPERLDRARWVLSSKDWLRFRLTGAIATDVTDASASFIDADTRAYSPRVLEAFGLGGLSRLLPEALEPMAVAGRVSEDAARRTGLRAGTPVAAGLHDIVASVVGSTGLETKRLCVIVGTFGVNVTLAPHPQRSMVVNSRLGPSSDTWTIRRTSRASMANLDWAVTRLALPPDGPDGRQSAGTAIEHVLDSGSPARTPFYLPYLFGGNGGQPHSASFVGLRSWHTAEDMLRAVVYGVTFSHRMDIEHLTEVSEIDEIHVVGGASNNRAWMQLFADVLRRPIVIYPGGQAGPRGAAMCAAVASGHARDLDEAVRLMRARSLTIEPREEQSDRLQDHYRAYEEIVRRLKSLELALPEAPVPESEPESESVAN